MSIYTFSFIGTGNMGSALARAAVRKLPPEFVFLSNRTHEKARALAEELRCVCGPVPQAAEQGKYVFLGVKPQMMGDLLAEIAPVCPGHHGGRADHGAHCGNGGGSVPRDPRDAQHPLRRGRGGHPLRRQRESDGGGAARVYERHVRCGGHRPAGGKAHRRGQRGVRVRPGLRVPAAGGPGRRRPAACRGKRPCSTPRRW